MLGVEQYKKFDNYYRTWTPSQRAVRVPLILVVTFMVVFGSLFLFSGKAFAQCKPGSAPTCPSPSLFQSKMNNGFFNKAAGLPYSKVFAAPTAAQDLFVAKYTTYWKNHPGQRKNMAQHAYNIAGSTRTQKGMARWNRQYPLHQTIIHGTGMKAAPIPARSMSSSRGEPKPITNCFAPYSIPCQAKFEWQNLGDATKCGVFHAYPNANNKRTCDMFRNPSTNDNPITKDGVQNGLVITFCTIGAVGAIVAVVSTGGAAAMLAATAATGGCAVALWEAVD